MPLEIGIRSSANESPLGVTRTRLQLCVTAGVQPASTRCGTGQMMRETRGFWAISERRDATAERVETRLHTPETGVIPHEKSRIFFSYLRVSMRDVLARPPAYQRAKDANGMVFEAASDDRHRLFAGEL